MRTSLARRNPMRRVNRAEIEFAVSRVSRPATPAELAALLRMFEGRLLAVRYPYEVQSTIVEALNTMRDATRTNPWWYGQTGKGTEAFWSKRKPTEASHGKRYLAVTGPHASRGAAVAQMYRYHRAPFTVMQRGKRVPAAEPPPFEGYGKLAPGRNPCPPVCNNPGHGHVRGKKTIEKDTPILPWAVADSVVREAVRILRVDYLPDEKRLINFLTQRAQDMYQRNAGFAKKIRGPGNTGRDWLYAFMRHWLSGELAKRGSRMPSEFAIGRALRNPLAGAVASGVLAGAVSALTNRVLGNPRKNPKTGEIYWRDLPRGARVELRAAGGGAALTGSGHKEYVQVTDPAKDEYKGIYGKARQFVAMARRLAKLAGRPDPFPPRAKRDADAAGLFYKNPLTAAEGRAIMRRARYEIKSSKEPMVLEGGTHGWRSVGALEGMHTALQEGHADPRIAEAVRSVARDAWYRVASAGSERELAAKAKENRWKFLRHATITGDAYDVYKAPHGWVLVRSPGQPHARVIDVWKKSELRPEYRKALTASANPSLGPNMNLGAVFSWLTKYGMGPKFGSRPIGWYQGHQMEAINYITDLAKACGVTDVSRVSVAQGKVRVFNPVSRKWCALETVHRIFDEADRRTRGIRNPPHGPWFVGVTEKGEVELKGGAISPYHQKWVRAWGPFQSHAEAKRMAVGARDWFRKGKPVLPNPALVAGDKVKYAVAHLRSLGIYTGPIPTARGRIMGFRPLGDATLADVDWGPGGRNSVNIKNLVRAGALEADNPAEKPSYLCVCGHYVNRHVARAYSPCLKCKCEFFNPSGRLQAIRGEGGQIIGLAAKNPRSALRRRKGAAMRMNPPSGPVDEDAARELELFVDNDADLYRQKTTPIMRALMARRAKGTFDPARAVAFFMYLMDAGAKKYIHQHGAPGQRIDEVFNRATRLEVARRFVKDFVTEADLGNYDSLLPRMTAKQSAARGAGDVAVDMAMWEKGHRYKAIRTDAPRMLPLYAKTLAAMEALIRERPGLPFKVITMRPPLSARENPAAEKPQYRVGGKGALVTLAAALAKVAEIQRKTGNIVSIEKANMRPPLSARENPLTRTESARALRRARGVMAEAERYGQFGLKSSAGFEAGRAVGMTDLVRQFGTRRASDVAGKISPRATKMGFALNPSAPRPGGVPYCKLCGRWGKSIGLARTDEGLLCRLCRQGKKAAGKNPRAARDRAAALAKRQGHSPEAIFYKMWAASKNKKSQSYKFWRSKWDALSKADKAKVRRVLGLGPKANPLTERERYLLTRRAAVRRNPLILTVGNPAKRNPPAYRNGAALTFEQARAYARAHGLLAEFDKTVRLQTRANERPEKWFIKRIPIGPTRQIMRAVVAHYGDSPETMYSPPRGSKKGPRMYRHKWGEKHQRPVPLLASSNGRALITALGPGQKATDWLRG